MSFEIAAAASAAIGPGAAGSASMPTNVGFGTPTQVGYGVSLNDIGGFNQALARIEARPVAATSETARQLMTPFEHINKEAVRLSADAQAAQQGGRDMSPGDVVMLTVRCQEFMFYCQLTSNIANRTSDGLQQLFRQQA